MSASKPAPKGVNVAHALRSWATQTIVHAMSLKAQADGKPFDNPERVKAGYAKAVETLNWLQKEAERDAELGTPAFCMKLTEKVLDWSWHHRKG
jgi:hypothetical protein